MEVGPWWGLGSDGRRAVASLGPSQSCYSSVEPMVHPQRFDLFVLSISSSALGRASNSWRSPDPDARYSPRRWSVASGGFASTRSDHRAPLAVSSSALGSASNSWPTSAHRCGPYRPLVTPFLVAGPFGLRPSVHGLQDRSTSPLWGLVLAILSGSDFLTSLATVVRRITRDPKLSDLLNGIRRSGQHVASGYGGNGTSPILTSRISGSDCHTGCTKCAPP